MMWIQHVGAQISKLLFEAGRKNDSSRGKRLALALSNQRGLQVLFAICLFCLVYLNIGWRSTPEVKIGMEASSLQEKHKKPDLVLTSSYTKPKRVKLKPGEEDILLSKLIPLDISKLTTVSSKLGWKGIPMKTMSKAKRSLKAESTLATFFSSFQDFDSLLVFFEYLSQRFPEFVTFGSIGTSAEGRPIVAMRIGTDTRPNSNPNVVVLGTEHGREHMVPMATCWAIFSILLDLSVSRTPGESPSIGNDYLPGDLGLVDILHFVNLVVVPVLNPDGYAYTFLGDENSESEELKQMRFWRKNRQINGDGTVGIDLNRNWGSDQFTWGFGQTWSESEVYMGKAPFEAKETRALRDFLGSPSDTNFKNDGRVLRAAKFNRKLHSLAQGFLAIHCCIGAILQPRNYCQVNKTVEVAHKLIGKEIALQMNKVGHGKYAFKQRRKTLEISSSGISIDWAFYDALIPYPMMIETSSSLEKLAKGSEAREISEGEDDEYGLEARKKSAGAQRKERLRAKMSMDIGLDIIPVGKELARAMIILAGLVSASLEFSTPDLSETVKLSPWGFYSSSKDGMYTCKNPGRPDLVPADLCAKNKLKPWIKCVKSKTSSGKGKKKK